MTKMVHANKTTMSFYGILAMSLFCMISLCSCFLYLFILSCVVECDVIEMFLSYIIYHMYRTRFTEKEYIGIF